MAYAVFIHRSDSHYKDEPTTRYQFPKQYLGRVQKCVGGWVIYYEPTKAGLARGYYAIAKVERVFPDPTTNTMYLALMKAGSYLEFVNNVPFSDFDGVVERGLLNERNRISGRAQAAVRPLSAEDFSRIVGRGISDDLLLPRDASEELPTGFAEEQISFADAPRERTEFLTSRIMRDRVFRKLVLRAYHERCALSGLKLINGGGRAEVAAAHIQPVQANGPDIVSNGLALSGTAHWMFDRGLVSLTDDLEILISRQVNDLKSVRAFVNASGRAVTPEAKRDMPHPIFLKWHRDYCFKS